MAPKLSFYAKLMDTGNTKVNQGQSRISFDTGKSFESLIASQSYD